MLVLRVWKNLEKSSNNVKLVKMVCFEFIFPFRSGRISSVYIVNKWVGHTSKMMEECKTCARLVGSVRLEEYRIRMRILKDHAGSKIF